MPGIRKINVPPARIRVGCSGLALGAAVDMDCIALIPAVT